MTEELINLLESVVVGLLTGIVTGVIVTKYYRKKDEAIALVNIFWTQNYKNYSVTA